MSFKNGGLVGLKGRSLLQGAVLLGAGAFLLGLAVSPARAWGALLVSNIFFLGAALCAIVFIAIQYVSGAGWPAVFRRVPEAMPAYILPGAILTGLMCLGLHDLYHWSHAEAVEHDAILRAKSAYLNAPGFAVRAAVFLALWWLFARLIRKNSTAQDADGDLAFTRRNTGLSAAFLVVFALTFSLASFDWIMSLEPHWFSTIFPWYVFGGVFVQGVAGIVLLLVLLRKNGLLREVNASHFHDLGKYLFAFSVFWAYLWFSQYLLIWYSNIPEETAYYLARSAPGWKTLFWLNPVVNFIGPFALLIRAASKRSERTLAAASLLILAGHWLDLYLMVMPPVLKGAPAFGWIEIVPFFAACALFLLAFDAAFRKAPPVPLKDPFRGESLSHHA